MAHQKIQVRGYTANLFSFVLMDSYKKTGQWPVFLIFNASIPCALHLRCHAADATHKAIAYRIYWLKS